MITAVLAAAWLIGLACAAWGAPGGPWAAAGLAALPATTLCHRRPSLALSLAAVSAGLGLLATARWEASTGPPPPSSIARLVDSGPVRLHGVLRSDPEERERSQRLRVAVREVETAEGRQAASGGVLVRVPLGRRLRAGDVVALDGHLAAPPELPHFDYRAFLARQGIAAQMDYPRLRVAGHAPPAGGTARLRAARRAAARALDRALPQPEAALARGIVVGDRAAIPAAVTDDFNRSGTSHLVAISGFNITLVAGMVAGACAWLLGRRRAAVVALAAILLYAIFVGLSPSVARALLMGALLIGASLLGRPGAPLVALALAAVAMTAHDPRVLNDVGFQLSFTATAGIMLLAPPMQAAGRRLTDSLAGAGWTGTALAGVCDTVAVTLAATLATAPVILYSFGRLSLVAPLANVLVVPAFPLVMLTSAAAALLGALLPSAAPVVGALAWPPLAYTIAVARYAARLPGASLDLGHPGGPTVLAMYLAGAAAILVLSRRATAGPAAARPAVRPLRLGATGTVLAIPLLLGAGFAAATILTCGSPDGRLTVTYSDAGGAPIALVTGPSGERVLVDTGAGAGTLARALDPLLPPRDRRLALIVITRRAPTATGGLELALARYRPRVLAAPPAHADAAPLPHSSAAFTALEPGSMLLLTRGARLEFEAVASDTERLAVVAALGSRRIAVTPGLPLSGAKGAAAEAGAVRTPATAAGQLTVAVAAVPGLAYDVRRQGPVRVSTDGVRIRMEGNRR